MKNAVLMPLKCDAAIPPFEWAKRLYASGLRRDDASLYIGVDADDDLWRTAHKREAASILDFVEVMSPADQLPGAVCAVWNRLAKRAVTDGCDGALILFGDDVTYTAPGMDWLDDVVTTVGTNPLRLFHPLDATDRSVCTFPIVGAAHVKLFGNLFPDCFHNQGADPFLHELYRRIQHITVMKNMTVENARGGPVKGWPDVCGDRVPPRPAYVPVPVTCSEDVVEQWAAKLADAVGHDPYDVGSIDVLVPTYRCNVAILEAIKTEVNRVPRARLCICVDDSDAARLAEVLALEAHNTRVRVNSSNLGAPMTRNRLLEEATASVALFLDDDVVPASHVVKEYLSAMLSAPARRACGLVGSVIFPKSVDVWHEATRMSGITMAFDWPEDVFPQAHVPWGVTASLCVWRKFAATFGADFAKTGGGEDVDFCLQVTHNSGLRWKKESAAVVYHPFWPRLPDAAGIVKYLQHFFAWTQGDGLLLDAYPQHVYVNLPNVVELSLPVVLLLGASAFVWLWAVELALEAHDALVGPHARHLCWTDRMCAAILSGIVKNVVDAGHLFYFLRRGRVGMCCHRFDWFCGVTDDVKRGERRKFVIRWALWLLGLACTV